MNSRLTYDPCKCLSHFFRGNEGAHDEIRLACSHVEAQIEDPCVLTVSNSIQDWSWSGLRSGAQK